jgi:hypothetical protein
MKKQLSHVTQDFRPLIDAELANDVDHTALVHRHGEVCAEIVKLREERDASAAELSYTTAYPDEASAIAAGALPPAGRPERAKKESVGNLNQRINVLEQAATQLATQISARRQDVAREMYATNFRAEQLELAEDMVEALLFFGETSGIETARLHDLQRAGITMLSIPRVGIPRLANSAAIREYLGTLKNGIGYTPTASQQQRLDALRKLEIEVAR